MSGINRWALYSSTFPLIFLLFFKGPRPFKSQKTSFSGLTTQYAPRLNRGTSAAKKHDSGQDIAWIFLNSGSNLFRSRPMFIRGFSFNFVDFLQQNLHSYYHCKDWNSGGFSPRTIHRFNALLVPQ